MDYIVWVIFKGLCVVGLVYLGSFIVESLTNLKLLIWGFYKWKKNFEMAQGDANLNAILFFIVCLITLLVDTNKQTALPDGYTFWKWLLIMIPLTVVFRMLYYRFTNKDQDRDDYDFSA